MPFAYCHKLNLLVTALIHLGFAREKLEKSGLRSLRCVPRFVPKSSIQVF